jgi:hypothetical protein
MYIKNIDKVPNAELFKTNKVIADWLITHEIPILSICGKEYIFSCTAELEIALTKIPFYLKPFLAVPKCFK